ncbi:MAG: amidase, partial [SAR324 cluster bacterium]
MATRKPARPAADAAADSGRPLWQLTALELARRIAAGEVSAVEAVEAHLGRMDAVQGALNAVVVRRDERARAEARAADRMRAQGEPLGPLHGVPVTVKECLDLEGTPSTYGLPSRRQHSALSDETHVARLRRAGAIVLGKTNVAQALAYIESDNPVYGRTNNPWHLERAPGGSSGGEGAIVAAGGSALGLGTDIGGSVRVPAAFCGIVGLKPTAGRTPDLGRGSFPVGQRAIQSQVGVLARSVADVAAGLEAINTVLSNTVPGEASLPLLDFSQVDLAGLRVGILYEDGVFPASAAYRRAVTEAAAALTKRGARIVELRPPAPALAFEMLYRLLSADRMGGLTRVLGKNPRDPRIKQLAQAIRTPAPLLALIKLLLRASGRSAAARIVGYFGPWDTDSHWQWAERQIDYQLAWLAALDQAPGGPAHVVLSPPAGLPAIRHGAAVEVGIAGAYACLYNVLGWPAGTVPVTRVRPEEETATARGKDVSDKTAAASERGS